MKTNLLLIAAFLSVIIYANIDELHGIVGMTRLDGSVGCVCHAMNNSDSVFVWIEGPDSIFVNVTAYYKILMTGGPAIFGGFNVAARTGHLDSLDVETRIIIGQLTHSAPKSFLNDTVFWSFKYTAPDSIVTDTIYSVANSVNGDSIPSELDNWNFGENFSVQVFDNPVGQIKELNQPEVFILEQNYPNPFNPSTKIRFTLPSVIASSDEIGTKQSEEITSVTSFPRNDNSVVTLKVFDVLGNEVAVLVNEEKSAGEYEVEFKGSEFPSGIYFYKLESNGYVQTRKMVLLK